MQKLGLCLLMIFVLQIALPASADEEPWEGDPMVVTGEATDGGNILCIGAACVGILNALVQESLFEQLTRLNLSGLLEGNSEPDLRVDRGEFCERLEDERPSGCSRSSSPSVPGLDPQWQPNGCGVGGWRDSALSALATLALPDFTGDLDEPFPGVSFEGACNAHDACYALQMGKLSCDNLLLNEANDACESNTSNESLVICRAMASTYFSAVVQHGDSAYESNADNLACAVWHAEMGANGCDS